MNQNNAYSQFGGLFDLYAVSDPNQASETLILSETNIGQTNGALVDFSSGITGNYQSAWVTSLGGDGGSIGFTIDNFEFLELTDYADYVIVTENVGSGVGQSIHSASYFTTAQSGMLIDPGKSSGGIDRLDVHSDSSIYLSYLDSTDSLGLGIDVNIGNSSVNVSLII